MESKKDFKIGDLVWSKMKNYPFWPSKIVTPPADAKPGTSKKAHHYVFFFGTENFAFIPEENIEHHSEEKLQAAASAKKKSASFKLALEKIIEEAKKHKPPVKEKEPPKKSSEVSTEKKVIKVEKTEKYKVPKKPTSKKRFFDESTNKRTSPPRKLIKKSDDYSALISNTPPNIGYKRVAVIKPLDGNANSFGSSAITRNVYLPLQPSPPLNLQVKSAALLARNIKPTDKKIGFIGLGMMGQRLVKNLIDTGHKVTIWNRTSSKCVGFVEIGAQQAQTPCELVEKCDIIFCCVSGPDASKSLVFGNSGILRGLEKSSACLKGYVEMTKIDPVTSKDIADAITLKGAKYLEAPILGSRQMAEESNLLISAAGNAVFFESCRSCFSALSKSSFFVSCDVGDGARMSHILGMLMGISNAALAEAMSLVDRNDLSQANFMDVLELGPLNSHLVSEKGRAIETRCFVSNNPLKHQLKDLNLALALGNSCEQPMLLTAAANEVFKHAMHLHYIDHDVSAVYLGVTY